MDNQQDQPGANTPNNANRPSQSPSAAATDAASGASPASRKSAPSPSAQSADAASDAAAQNTANAGTDRQGEGQQTNASAPAGALLDAALTSGKKWIEDSGVLNNVNHFPQSIKDLGNRALDKVNGLSTTQKVVGGAILAAGIGWLATRKGKSGSSSDSSPYNYGRQRDAGSYGRRSYGYQAPDASTSRPSASGASSRADSGSPYGNSGSRYGGSSSSYGNAGVKAGSGRSESSTGASATTDHGSQFSSHSSRSTSAGNDFGSNSDE